VEHKIPTIVGIKRGAIGATTDSLERFQTKANVSTMLVSFHIIRKVLKLLESKQHAKIRVQGIQQPWCVAEN